MLAIELEENGRDEGDDQKVEVVQVGLLEHTVKRDNTSRLYTTDSNDEEDEDEDDDEDMKEFTEGMMDITLEDEEEDEENELGDRGMTFLPHFQSNCLAQPIWMPSTPLASASTSSEICEGGERAGGGNREREREYDKDPGLARVDSVGKRRPAYSR